MTLILLATAVTLLVALLGVRELLRAQAQRRLLTVRSAPDDGARPTGLWAGLDRRLRCTEPGRLIERRIAASGMRVDASTFLALMLVAVVAVLFLIGGYLGPVFGVAAGVGVVFVFFGFLRRREDRRREEFIGQMPELARVLSNASSAGLVLRTAIEMAADELDEPASGELHRTAEALRLGQPLEEALRELGERLPSRELAVLVSTLIVAARSGGSLVTSLRGIAGTLEERKEIRREIRTIMGEAVISNWSVGVLGIGSLFLVNLIQPGVLRKMSEHLGGQILLGLSTVMFVSSLLIIRRITRINV
ncbi:MAG TPA: type II secretion system F family protein [Actinoallomurus sp.]